MNPNTDPCVVSSREKLKFLDQFNALNPVNGQVTGGQARDFFLQSQLPPLVLGQIWALADTDADGKMTLMEFSIACKLINLKLRGFEVPKQIPPTLLSSLTTAGGTPIMTPPGQMSPLIFNRPMMVHQQPPHQLPTVQQPQPIIPMQPQQQQQMPPMIPPQPHMPPMIPPQPQQILAQAAAAAPAVIPPPIPVAPVIPPMPIAMPIPAAAMPPAIPPQPIIPVQPVAYPPVIPPQPMMMPMQQPVAAPILPGVSSGLTSPIQAAMPANTSLLIQAKKPSGGNLLDSLDNANDISLLTNGAAPKPPSQPGTRSGSISDPTAIPYEAKSLDWAVKNATKLKYTQLFNNTDHNRVGYLTGPQARNIMVMTKLPQAILAQIWNLSDMDSDGKLSCEEFVLSMHLCEMGLRGEPIPTVLPMELIPPSFRKPTSRSGSVSSRHDSISSQGKAGSEAGDIPHSGSSHGMLVNQTSFEDKRKLNFDKGQAELERRRKVLEDAQKREKEERERKEREEFEKKEKLRLEAERKKQEELDRQLQMQRELEEEREEDRKRQLEAKEAAKKEMERQRQLEWEKTKFQEMENQRQREQESLLKLKAQNQTYTLELSTLTEKIKALSQQICETRSNVTGVKTVIDGMRSTRDTSNSEMATLKNKIKEQNAKLVQLSQEKVRVEARSKEVLNNEQAFSNRQIMINQLKDKLENTKQQLEAKSEDVVTHTSELTDLKSQLSELITTCEDLYSIYEVQRSQVVELKEKKQAEYMNAKWDDSGSTWDEAPAAAAAAVATSVAAVSDAATNGSSAAVAAAEVMNYRALYGFEARNGDELSFEPGDIIQVVVDPTAEPGWFAGTINGRTGWFPDAYVEPCGDDVAVAAAAEEVYPAAAAAAVEVSTAAGSVASTIPAAQPVSAVMASAAAAAAAPIEPVEAGEYYVASYPYESGEPDDLTFEAGESILVVKKDGDWWTGKIGFRVGIFPANYVTLADDSAPVVAAAAAPVQAAAVAAAYSPPAVASPYSMPQEDSRAQQDVDSEVSEINTKPAVVDNVPQSASQTPSFRAKKTEIAQVIAPYEATTAEQLSLSRGQLIMIRKKTDSGWWEGELQAKGRKKQVGWFPATYVKVLQGGRNSGRNTPLSASRVDLHETILDKVIALYPYKAQNDDELSFEKDDIISVVGRDEPEWWRGELNGLSGVFPSNYVGKFVTSGNV